MKGTYTGLGVAFGAGLGLLVGILFLDTWWFGMAIGAAIGLVVGSLAEIAFRDRGSGGGA
ncbi:MAG: hypothetical protein EOL89_10385 [Actinobacteria bacterium]|nr:hypothetical protein [Actinomycetota bacterium]